MAKYFDQVAGYGKQCKGDVENFDFATLGSAPQRKAMRDEYFKPILDSGAITWWIERVYSWKGDLGHIRRKIREGPPDI